MSLQIASLNSGSNGNCYYIANSTDAILVDAGLSCRETEKRLLRSGLSIKKVRAIFISHEHSDHIKGVEVLSKKHQLPVYITKSTLKNSGLQIRQELLRIMHNAEVTSIGNLIIKAFPKLHDAADPCSFLIEHNGTKVGVFTDLGACCDQLVAHFSQCHAAFLEANYDTEMLMNGNYPYYLKKRISGGEGHLSNHQALELFLLHRSQSLSHLLLSHLSQENNSPQLVQKLFEEHAGSTFIEVASRRYESRVHVVGNSLTAETAPLFPGKAQLSIF